MHVDIDIDVLMSTTFIPGFFNLKMNKQQTKHTSKQDTNHKKKKQKNKWMHSPAKLLFTNAKPGLPDRQNELLVPLGARRAVARHGPLHDVPQLQDDVRAAGGPAQQLLGVQHEDAH